jgi:Flp pilus assembly protein TadG
VIAGRRSHFRADEGTAAVEGCIILSVVLLLITGSIECGRALWTHNTMLVAVQEAGRYAMISRNASLIACGAQNPTPSCPVPSTTSLASCTAARAQQVLAAYQATNIDVSAHEDHSSTPTTMTVCASHTLVFAAPGLLPFGPLNLTSQVTVPLSEHP